MRVELNSFTDYLRFEKKYAAHTCSSYQNDLIQFTDFIEMTYGFGNPGQVNHLHVKSWIAELISQKITPRSINRKLSTLKSFYKFLIRNEKAEENPLLKIHSLKTEKRLPDFVDEEKMKKIFSDKSFEDNYEGRLERLILELFYQTGMRRAELIGLKQADFDPYSLSLKVLGKRNKERFIPVSKELRDLVKGYIEEKHTLGFTDLHLLVNEKGKPLNENSVYLIVRKHLGKITTLKKRSPHILRHTFATHLLDNGADINAVKELLGHASLSATQVYTHNTVDKLKRIYKQAHPRA